MLTKKMQRSKELQASNMKEFFKNNVVYKKHYYFDKSLNQHYLKDFRLIADGHDVAPVEKPEAVEKSEYELTKDSLSGYNVCELERSIMINDVKSFKILTINHIFYIKFFLI